MTSEKLTEVMFQPGPVPVVLKYPLDEFVETFKTVVADELRLP